MCRAQISRRISEAAASPAAKVEFTFTPHESCLPASAYLTDHAAWNSFLGSTVDRRRSLCLSAVELPDVQHLHAALPRLQRRKSSRSKEPVQESRTGAPQHLRVAADCQQPEAQAPLELCASRRASTLPKQARGHPDHNHGVTRGSEPQTPHQDFGKFRQTASFNRSPTDAGYARSSPFVARHQPAHPEKDHPRRTAASRVNVKAATSTAINLDDLQVADELDFVAPLAMSVQQDNESPEPDVFSIPASAYQDELLHFEFPTPIAKHMYHQDLLPVSTSSLCATCNAGLPGRINSSDSEGGRGDCALSNTLQGRGSSSAKQPQADLAGEQLWALAADSLLLSHKYASVTDVPECLDVGPHAKQPNRLASVPSAGRHNSRKQLLSKLISF